MSRPDNCPRCHYSLRGLPESHRCPECGFPYGQETLVWGEGNYDTGREQAIRGRRLRRAAWTCMKVGVLTVVVCWVLTELPLFWMCVYWFRFPGEVVFVLPPLAIAAAIWLRRRRPPRVYLTPDGVEVSHHRTLRHLGWGDVLEVGWDGNAAVIDPRLGKGPTVFIRGIDQAEFPIFREEIIHRRDAALAQSAAATPD